MINELLKDKDRDTEFLVIAALRYCIGAGRMPKPRYRLGNAALG